MKLGLFPGSFNPWHEGHQEILEKALKVFDQIIVVQGNNPEKEIPKVPMINYKNIEDQSRVELVWWNGLLVDFINSFEEKPDAIIKGLRNAQDLEYETCQQYWNEDLGIDLPMFYIITGRDKRHLSSSALRALEKVKK